jgi:transposase
MDLGLPPKPSRESLVAMCRDEPERAADLILMLWEKVEQLAATVEEQAATIAAQGEQIAALSAKLGKDSHNSSKPPSSDRHNPGGSPPPKSSGKKGRKKKPGAQPGHKGTTLRKSEAPDHVVDLPPPTRCSCGESLAGTAPCGETQRQVFDLPVEIKVEVTEYRSPVCQCSSCGKKNTAPFPAEAKAPVQYGERIRAAATYLHVYHLLPYERLAGLFADLFGCKLAAGTLPRFIRDASARAGPIHEKIREEVVCSNFMHNDETGLKILGRTSWLHVASTPQYAYFEVTPGRSFEDIKSVGVLEGYSGRSIHDFLPAYLKFEGLEHGLCNAHHLRDLTFVEEHHGQRWPVEMIELLLEGKKLKDREGEGGRKVGPATLARLRARYQEILALGRAENPEPERRARKRGRPARGKALNLLDRFTTYEEETLAFLLHGVPFDNNEAERDLRMMKTRQKISGCFRSLEWSRRFAKVRSVIASAKKRSVDVYAVMQKLFSDPAEGEKMLFNT